MEDGYRALLKNETWELVKPNNNMKIVENKWIYKLKYNPDGSIARYRARLVAKGYHQTARIDYTETFSPVAKSATIKVVLSLAVNQRWDVKQVDVNNTFLKGELNEEVYMEQPEGFVNSEHPSPVCKLRKALYGLKQAPRVWYEKLRCSLMQWGFKNVISDTSLFCLRNADDVLIFLVYVDNILMTGVSPRRYRGSLTI